MELTNDFEVTFNGMTFQLNFMKIYHSVRNVLVEDTQTRQRGDLISSFFTESRLLRALFSNPLNLCCSLTVSVLEHKQLIWHLHKLSLIQLLA